MIYKNKFLFGLVFFTLIGIYLYSSLFVSSSTAGKLGNNINLKNNSTEQFRKPAGKEITPARVKMLTSTPTPKDVTNLNIEISKINELERCYSNENCDYSKADPRSYEIALGQDISHRLQKILKDFQQEKSGDDELNQLAIKFIKSDDGFVQEAALEILKSLPPSEKNLQALIEGLKDKADPLILQQSIPELKRYLQTAEEAQVHRFIQDTLSTGAQFASVAASESVPGFLNKKSYSQYADTLKHMQPGTTAAKNLKSALEEYRLMATGG